MKPRILIIEDEAYFAANLGHQIRDLGYEVAAIINLGEEAVRTTQSGQYDLAIVDLRLNGSLDGIETAQKLRAHHGLESIFMTGLADQKLLDQALQAQPYGFLTKPFTPHALRISIEMALQRLKAESTLREREEQLATVLKTSMDSFWSVGLDGRIVDVNEAACLMTGYSRSELLQMNIVQLEHGRTTEQIAAGIELVIRHGAIQIERLARRKDGQIRLIDMSVTCTPPPFRRLYCFGRDITERRQAENAVREREQRLSAIIETIPYAVWLKDPDGHYLSVNKLWCRTYGQKSENVIGRTDSDLFDNEAATLAWQRDEQVRRTGIPVITEIEHHGPSGRPMWLDVREYPVLDKSRHCVGLVGVLLDITERRASQKRLQLLHRAVEQSPASIIITDTAGNIEYVNPYFEKHTGYSVQEVIGKNPRILNSGFHTKTFFTELWSTLCSGNEWRGEIQNRRKDGMLYWEQASISPVRDEEGNIISYIAVKEDITERKTAEMKMAWQAALVENSNDICCVKDLDLRVLTANMAMARSAGAASPAELIGKTDAEIYRLPTSSGDVNAYMEDEVQAQQLPQGRVLVRHEKLHAADGGERHLLTRKFPVFNHDGKLIATANISTDITETKRAEQELIRAKEEAETANKAKSAFLATMSHELCTPLNVINGMASILSQSSWPPEQQHAIDMISEGGTTLLTIIEEILDFSGLQAGKTKLESSSFSPLTVVANALRLFSASAKSKGIRLTSSFDPETPAELVGDPRRLQQIIVNLLQNAVKFTEHGRVHLRLSVQSSDQDACVLQFSVRDTGIGVAPENIGKLFEPFTQADSSITRRFGGSGLGLAICKSFVELMGGSIDVCSRPGRGSVFKFTVRFSAGAHHGKAFVSLGKPVFRGRRVLVCGSRGAQHRSLLSLLKSWDLQVLQPPEDGSSRLPEHDFTVFDAAGLHQPCACAGSKDTPLIWFGHLPQGARPLPARSVHLQSTALEPMELAAAIDQLLSGNNHDATAPTAGKAAPSPSAQLSLSILAAEDNQTNREVIKLVLRHIGHAVDLVVNGAEAVEAVRNKHYDLLLLDMQMPVMDGLTAAEEICRLFPDPSTRVCMVALTANALAGDRERCLAAGMDDFLTKPVLPAELRACILRHFESPGDSSPSIQRRFLKTAPKPQEKPPGSTPPVFPLIDIPHLHTITAGLPPDQIWETLASLQANVGSDFSDTYQQIVEVCSRRDQKHFAETIHGLKGCFMMTGWTRAGKWCAQALMAAREGVFDQWTTFPDELSKLYHLSNQAMTALLATLQNPSAAELPQANRVASAPAEPAVVPAKTNT